MLKKSKLMSSDSKKNTNFAAAKGVVCPDFSYKMNQII